MARQRDGDSELGGQTRSRFTCARRGGYVIVPPSVHPSGTAYKFVDENIPIAPAPEWLLEMLALTTAAPQPPLSVTPTGTTKMPNGSRNYTLTGLAGTMRRKGMTPAAIQAALLAENKASCDPPLDEGDVKAIAISVCRYEPPVAPCATSKSTSRQEWPAPLGQEAFLGIAGDFVQLVEPETESDASALLFSFLVTIGSIIGRGPYYPSRRRPANTWVAGLFVSLAQPGSIPRREWLPRYCAGPASLRALRSPGRSRRI